jgi:hypothetical protein
MKNKAFHKFDPKPVMKAIIMAVEKLILKY